MSGQKRTQSAERSRGPLLLLAEDVLDVRLVLAEILVRAGFMVVEASNGHDAVVKARSLQPDAIVLDVSLPLLDGVGAARVIRAAEGTRNVPIVALTGLHEDAFDHRVFDVVLHKPCMPDVLVRHVRAAIERRTASGTSPRVPRVLVVDDEPLIAESMRLVLSDDFDVTSTTDPADALARLTSPSGEGFDVILCDVMMPKMNGVELRNRVHAVNPELAARIVLMTGGIQVANVQMMVESVPNVVLTKPFDFDSLRDFIRRRALEVVGRLARR
jgi:CheY-like chemotaxis protein